MDVWPGDVEVGVEPELVGATVVVPEDVVTTSVAVEDAAVDAGVAVVPGRDVL